MEKGMYMGEASPTACAVPPLSPKRQDAVGLYKCTTSHRLEANRREDVGEDEGGKGAVISLADTSPLKGMRHRTLGTH